MSRIVLLCPSRGRPEKAKEAHESFASLKQIEDTRIVIVPDADDPSLREYMDLSLPLCVVGASEPGMGPALNKAAKWALETQDPSIIGFIGDDHRCRAPGWDRRISEVLQEKAGFAYGYDGGRADIPTQVFISASIVRALGWMSLPGATHLYLDNTWAELGHRADCLYYLPDVLIEHMHPVYGKGDTDEGYRRVNSPAMYGHDGQVFQRWMDSGQAALDAQTVRSVLERG